MSHVRAGGPDNSRGNHRLVTVVSGQPAVFTGVLRRFWPHFAVPIIMSIIMPIIMPIIMATSCVLCPAVSAEHQ